LIELKKDIKPIINKLNILNGSNINDVADHDQFKDISNELSGLIKAEVKHSWEIHSLKLFLDPNFISKVKVFSIRFHDAIRRGKHFDYCLGNFEDRLAIDFIIPSKLSSNDIVSNDNLPRGIYDKTLIFVGSHNSDPYLVKATGYGDKVKSGYGAGKWRIVKKGRASLRQIESEDELDKTKKNKWELVLGNDKYILTQKMIDINYKNLFKISRVT